jgi:chromosome segregation ATPase
VELVAFPASFPVQREGLPYWIFWFMLCIILLLVFFVFLRDKRLRMRLSGFLAGARRRSILLQLKFKLKKERQGKAALMKRLGEKAWDEDVRIPESESLFAQLRDLLEKRNAEQEEWKNAFGELERLHGRLDEVIALYGQRIQQETAKKKPHDELLKRKRDEEKALKKLPRDREMERQLEEIKREKEEIRKKISEYEAAIKEIQAEGSSQRREVEKEIHHWTKRKHRTQERIKAIEAEQQELYLELGQMLEENRIGHRALLSLYDQADSANVRIATLQHRINTLSGGDKALLPPGLRS